MLVAAIAARASTPAAPPEPAASPLPEGQYRALVLRTCAACHSIELVVATRRTEEQWDQLIGVMVDRGAKATDDEQAHVLEYLVQNFGRSDAPLPVPAPATHP